MQSQHGARVLRGQIASLEALGAELGRAMLDDGLLLVCDQHLSCRRRPGPATASPFPGTR